MTRRTRPPVAAATAAPRGVAPRCISRQSIFLFCALLLIALVAQRLRAFAGLGAGAPPGGGGGGGGGPSFLRAFMQSLRVPPLLYLEDAHCRVVEWASVPAVEPELWVGSSVYHGRAHLLNFSLALPPRSQSFVADFMASSPGMWAPRTTMLLLSVLTSPKVRQAAGVVVDVGANLGYFSQLSLSLGYEVVAFEPQARALPYLAATAARNGNGPRFHLFPCAVGSVVGEVEMGGGDGKWETATLVQARALEAAAGGAAAAAQGESTAASVPMTRLSDILRPGVPIALLKINVERYERGVLAGLPPGQLRDVRNVLVEAGDAETRAYMRKLMEGEGFFCRQIAEVYALNENGVDKGNFLETRLERSELIQITAQFLVDCKDNGPDFYFFTKQDFPWSCSTVGCG